MNKNSRCEQKHLICDVTKCHKIASARCAGRQAFTDWPHVQEWPWRQSSARRGQKARLDYMISFRLLSTMSDTERAGRTMTLTKPTLRSSLGNEHFNVQAGSLGGPQLARLPPGRCDGLCQALEGRWQPLGHHERCDRPARKGGAGAQGQGAQGHIPLVRKQSGSNLSANLPSCALSASRRVAGHSAQAGEEKLR